MGYEDRERKVVQRKRKDGQSLEVAKEIFNLLQGGKQLSAEELRLGIGKCSNAILRNALTVCTLLCPLYEVDRKGITYYGLLKDEWYGEERTC